MSADSKIEWCDHTFNPWIGCTKVGPGCDHCYAERDFDQRRHVVSWGPGRPRHRTRPDNWKIPLKQWQAGAAEFQRQHGRRQRVFCASLADVFDNEVDPSWRADLFQLIEATPDLDWLLLTKRIGNVHRMMIDVAASLFWMDRLDTGALPSNVWLGATIVNQAEYDRDIGKLLRTPAAVHFLSVEPMLGAIDMRMGGASMPDYQEHRPLAKLDWVICGGESGPKARPMEIDWARSLAQQCKTAGVAFHMKQLGAQPRGWCAAQVHADPADREDDACDLYEAHECRQPCPARCAALVHKKGADMAEWPEDLRVREFPHANP